MAPEQGRAELCHKHEVSWWVAATPLGRLPYTSHYARKVYMVVGGDGLKETVSQYLIDRISASPHIEVRPHTEILQLHGTKQLEAITLINNLTGQQQTVQTCWLFLAYGGIPNTNWAAEAGLVRDEQCYLVTGPDLRTPWVPEEMASGSRTVLPGNQQPRSVRRWRCSSRVRETLRLRCRRRRDGCYLCPPLFSEPLK